MNMNEYIQYTFSRACYKGMSINQRPFHATFSVRVDVLERLHQSQCLVNRTSHRKVIYGDLSQVAFSIDDEKSTAKQTCSNIQDNPINMDM